MSLAYRPLAENAFIILAIFATFWIGIWARGAIEGSRTYLTRRQSVAAALFGFFLIGVPLGNSCLDAWRKVFQSMAAGADYSVFPLLLTFVPSFLAGLTSREDFRKFVKERSGGAAPAPADG